MKGFEASQGTDSKCSLQETLYIRRKKHLLATYRHA